MESGSSWRRNYASGLCSYYAFAGEAEMRREGEERAERSEERENGKGEEREERRDEERGERREERENGVGASHSEEFRSDARVEGPAAQAVASARQMRSQQPSTLIVERGGIGGGAPVVVDYFPGAAGVKVGMTLGAGGVVSGGDGCAECG